MVNSTKENKEVDVLCLCVCICTHYLMDDGTIISTNLAQVTEGYVAQGNSCFLSRCVSLWINAQIQCTVVFHHETMSVQL